MDPKIIAHIGRDANDNISKHVVQKQMGDVELQIHFTHSLRSYWAVITMSRK